MSRSSYLNWHHKPFHNPVKETFKSGPLAPLRLIFSSPRLEASGLQFCFVTGVAVVILKTVFSFWRIEYIQKLQSSPLSTGKRITKRPRRDGPFPAAVLPCHWPHLAHSEEAMGHSTPIPPWYALMWNLRYWPRPGQRNGKSTPFSEVKYFLAQM